MSRKGTGRGLVRKQARRNSKGLGPVPMHQVQAYIEGALPVVTGEHSQSLYVRAHTARNVLELQRRHPKLEDIVSFAQVREVEQAYQKRLEEIRIISAERAR